jgi:hypothetical protein
MRAGPRSGSRILCLISLCVYSTPRMVTHGNVCRPPESCTPIWPYQRLPDPVLAERNPVVDLVWSTNCYHRADLSLTRGCTAFTNDYHRDEGDRVIDSHMHDTVAGWAGWARVMYSENGGTQWRTLKEGQNGGWSASKTFSEKIFLGRHAF